MRAVCTAAEKMQEKLIIPLSFSRYFQSGQKRFQQFHRQAHYVRQAALDFFDEFVAGLLYGVCSGLIAPGAAFDVVGDLLSRHFLRINGRTVAPQKLRAVAEPDNCNAGYYLVGRAEELSGYLLGLFGEREEPEPTPEQAAPVELDEAQRAELRQTIRQNILKIALAAALIVVFLPITGFLREYTSAYALGRMSVDMTRDVCAKVLALPLRFHHVKKRGDVYTRVVSDVGVAHSALGLIFSDVAQAGVTIVVGVGAMLIVSWKLSLALVLVGPLIFGTVSLFGRRIRETAKKRQPKS